MVAVVFLYQITVFFLQQNTTASLLELYFNDSMQTVYARGGGGGSGSQQREVADGADVHRLVTMFMQLPVYEILLVMIICKSLIVLPVT